MVVYYFACSSGCSCILRSMRVILHTVETIFSGTSSHSHSTRPRKLFCPLCKCPLVVVRAVVLCTLRCARMCAHLTLFHSGRRGWARLGGAQMCAHLLLSPDVHHSGAQKLETGQNAPVLVHECSLYIEEQHSCTDYSARHIYPPKCSPTLQDECIESAHSTFMHQQQGNIHHIHMHISNHALNIIKKYK